MWRILEILLTIFDRIRISKSELEYLNQNEDKWGFSSTLHTKQNKWNV